MNNINYFTYYFDIVNDTTYIERNIYEKLQKYNIETTSTPKIINNKNCYSIDKDILNKFIETSKYIGQRVLILLKEDKKVIKKKQILNICNYNNQLFIKEDMTKSINISNKAKIKVDGLIYINVTEEDIKTLKTIYNKEGIELENNILKIIPLKKNN